MLMFWRRKCFTWLREGVVYGFRLPLWYLHTLLTWFCHFKSCLIIIPRFLASSNDSSGWTWRVQLNVIGFFLFRVTDRTLHLLGWRGIIHFLPILPVWRDLVEDAWHRWWFLTQPWMRWCRLQIVAWWGLGRLAYRLYNSEIDYGVRLTLDVLQIRWGHGMNVLPIITAYVLFVKQ